MPSSFPENISPIVKILQKYHPDSICDIGIGRGKYGLLAKEYLGEKTRVYGVEVFEPYITPITEAIYDEIIIDNALELLSYPKADIYLMIDVIEHWPKDKANELIKRLLAGGGKILISTPRADCPQGEVNGNKWERHISIWHGEEFEKYPYRNYCNDISFMYLLGNHL